MRNIKEILKVPARRENVTEDGNKFMWIFAILFIFIIAVTTFGLFVFSVLKVQILTDELNLLKKELHHIKLATATVDDPFYPNLGDIELYDDEISFPIVYDSNCSSDSENDDYGRDYLEDDNVSSDDNLSEMTHGNPNASQVTVSLVKREISDSNAEGLSLGPDDSKEILSDNQQPTETFTRRTRARNSWRQNVDVEEIEPKSTSTPRKRNRNRHRNNNLESLQQAIVHFSGDTSKYVLGKHENFKGNGHLRHPNQIFADWKESDWVKPLGMNEKFDFMNGYLKIKDNGLYFVYAQIYYLDEHDTNGFHVHKNRDAILQCTVMTHSLSTVTKGNTCYTAGVEYLREGDEISIRDVGSFRYSLFEPGKSFFGVIKLGDVKVK